MEIKALASGSAGNCYLINSELMIECGISIDRIRKGCSFRLTEIKACLISHEHQDHAKAVKGLMKAGIDCYMSQGTAEALGVSGHRVNIIKAKQQFRLGAWTILPFETQHDVAEPLGFLMANQDGEKLLYATDTYFIRHRFQGLTHIMIEANYSLDILRANVEAGSVPKELKTRILKSHFSLENVKKFLLANDLSKVEAIFLLHLSDNNSDSERFKREVMELTGKPTYIAHEG
jgi:phosphoribosyl 1,2-cyclic phosphodiesterase